MSQSPLAAAAPATFRSKHFGRWLDAVNQHFVPMDGQVEDRNLFHAAFRVRRTGRGAIAVVAGGGSSVARTRGQAAGAERGHFKILWQLAGRCCLQQRASHVDLGRGQIAIYDITRPYRLDMDRDSRFVVLSLDSEDFPAWRALLAADAPRRLDHSAAGQAALMSLMSLLRPDVDLDDADLVVDSAAALMQAAVARSEAVEPEDRRHARLAEARRIVQAHLNDPALGPELLAERLGISRRSLYLLFESQRTTPAAFIREQRLQHCRAALAGPLLAHRTLTEIAHEFGFFDSAHFSRSFRAAFGASPSAWRRQARAAAG